MQEKNGENRAAEHDVPHKVIDVEEIQRDGDTFFEPIINSTDIFDEAAAENRKKGWKWWSFMGVFGIVLVLLVAVLAGGKTVDEPESVAVDVVKTEDEIYKATYVERELLCEGCGHIVTDLLHGDSRFVGKTFSQLEAEGWKVSKTGSNKVKIYRKVRGFCDVDSGKRTLRLTENGIGIFQGPKTAAGDLLNEMTIDTAVLPEEMQGELQGEGMEFDSEEELLATLDSLDEYVGYEDGSYYTGIV